MAITYQKIFEPTVLTTSAVTIFTVPATPATTLFRGGRVRFTNTNTVAVSVTAYAVPLAGSASAGNAITNAQSIPPNISVDIDVPLMKAGDFFQALAGTATSITIHCIAGSYFS